MLRSRNTCTGYVVKVTANKVFSFIFLFLSFVSFFGKITNTRTLTSIERPTILIKKMDITNNEIKIKENT